jgi:hypothetical protein
MAEPADFPVFKRFSDGRFAPGGPGGPGRPRHNVDLAAAARQYGPEIIARLVAVVRHEKDIDHVLRAADMLLMRGYGRPALALKLGALEVEPFDPATLDDASLERLLVRLEAFVAGAPTVIDLEPVELPRDPVVDGPKT